MSFWSQLPNELKGSCIEHMDIVSRLHIAQCSSVEQELVARLPTQIDKISLTSSQIIIEQKGLEITLTACRLNLVLLIKNGNKCYFKSFSINEWDWLIGKILSQPKPPTIVKILEIIPNIDRCIVEVDLRRWENIDSIDHKSPDVLIPYTSIQRTVFNRERTTVDLSVFRTRFDLLSFLDGADQETFGIPTIRGSEGCCLIGPDLMRFSKLTHFEIHSSLFRPTIESIDWFIIRWLSCPTTMSFSFIFSMARIIFDFTPILIKYRALLLKKRSETIYSLKKNKNEYAIFTIDINNYTYTYSFFTRVGKSPNPFANQFQNIEPESVRRSTHSTHCIIT